MNKHNLQIGELVYVMFPINIIRYNKRYGFYEDTIIDTMFLVVEKAFDENNLLNKNKLQTFKELPSYVKIYMRSNSMEYLYKCYILNKQEYVYVTPFNLTRQT